MITWLFDLNPGPYFPLHKTALTVFSFLIFIGILVYFVRRSGNIKGPLRAALRGVPFWFTFFGFLGYFLVLCRLGGIPYLSIRLGFVLLGACFLWYLYTLWIGYQEALKKHTLSSKVHETLNKYMPKPKKKKRKKRR